MNLPQDITPLLQDWLHEPDGLPPPRMAALAPLVHQAPQQRGILPPLERSFHSMFTATRIFLAVAFMATASGVLTGALNQQQRDVSGLAALSTASASPASSPMANSTASPTASPELMVRTDILPSVPLTVEEVEPGVYQVLSDGIRDLMGATITGGLVEPATRIWAAPDGSIWLPRSDSFIRIGDPEGYPGFKEAGRKPQKNGYVVGLDGALWRRQGKVLHSLDNDISVSLKGIGADDSFAVEPDGTLWITRNGPHLKRGEERSITIERIQDGSRTTLPPLPRLQEPDAVIAVKGDIVWTLNPGRISRWDGSRWQSWGPKEDIAPPIDQGWGEIGLAEVAADGALWAQRGSRSGEDLAYFDGSTWSVYKNEARNSDSPYCHGTRYKCDAVDVDPEGSIWVNASSGGDPPNCGGVGRFDRDEWQYFLRGICVDGIATAPDGSTWVKGVDWTEGPEDWEPGPSHVYVITAAANESGT